MKKADGILTEITKEDLELLKTNPKKFWKDVTEIGENAFGELSDLTEISIPESITKIGKSAFWGTGLTSISLPKGLTKIETGLFSQCENLKTVSIPDTVTEIEEAAFYDTAITSISIPNSVKTIKNGAFAACKDLESITIPESVTEIEKFTFNECSKLTSVSLSNSLTKIGEKAFNECSSLNSINIPEKVTEIGENAFFGCSNLRDATLPEGLTTLDYGAFSNCTGLTEIKLPSTLTKIENAAFGNCTNLSNVVISEGTKEIEGGAFGGCTSLKSIKLPDSVELIDGSFGSCKNLESIELSNNLKRIGEWTFSNCPSLKKIKLPKSIEKIEENAFAHSKLEEISLECEDGVHTIPATVENLNELETDISAFRTKIAEPERETTPTPLISFEMPVKTKSGIVGSQKYSFGEENNIIKVGDFDIAKGEDGKWSLNFSLENNNAKEVAKAIALPNEINMATKNVHIPLSKVKIADNGNIEFELETTKDRRTGNTRNFTITPNSIKTAKTEIPTRSTHDTDISKSYNDVILPKNFAELFLGNETTSTIDSTLPTEFFQTIIRNKEAFSDTKVVEIKNTTGHRISLLKVDDNLYTLVNSKMMKVESVFNIKQESGNNKVGFIFKKGAEKIARVLSEVELDEQLKVMNITGIKFEDWNDKSRHLYDDTTLSTQGLTAKEFKTTDRSRAKNLTSDGIEPEAQPEQSEPESSFDITPDENDTTEPTQPTQAEQDSETSQEETQSAEDDDTNKDAAAETESKTAPENESTQPSTDNEQNEQSPEKEEPSKEEPGKEEQNNKKDDKKDNKKETYKFSLTPLFYGIGLFLSVLSILTGMVWLLALGALFFATPKMTEGIVNDKKTATYQESERMKKLKKSLEKTKEKIKDNLKLQTNLIKSKDKDLKLAHKLLRQKTRQVKMTKEWTDATKDMFEDGKVSVSTKELLDKLEYPAKSSQFKNHSEKLKQFDEFLTSVQNEIENPDGRFNDKQKEELAPLIKTTLENLKTAQDLNSELSQASGLGSALKNEANFSTLTPQKMTAGLQGLGLDTKDIVDEEGKSIFGEETITKLNQQFDDKFQTYKEYLDKDGILEENIANVYETMDKFQSTKATNNMQTQQP